MNIINLYKIRENLHIPLTYLINYYQNKFINYYYFKSIKILKIEFHQSY